MSVLDRAEDGFFD